MTDSTAGPRALATLTDIKVFDFLSQAPTTRTQIAADLGISKPTASQAISRLQENGLVVALDRANEPKRGRVPEHYGVDSSFGHVLALCLQAEFLQVRAGDLGGKILVDRLYPLTARTGTAEVEQMAAREISRVRAELGSPLLAAGVSQSAPVLRNGAPRVLPTPIFPASGADLAGQFNPEVPVLLDNDVNWMAVAEAEGQNDSLMMLYIGSGLGAGLVIDGQLHRGKHGTAGELETQMVGASNLRDALAEAGMFQTRVLWEKLADERNWPAFFAPLSAVLANLIGFVDPQRVVAIGPGMNEKLCAALESALNQKLSEPVRVQHSTLGTEAAARGALAGAREQALGQLWENYRAR